MTRLDANDTGRNEEGLGISDNAAVISQFISSPRRHQMELFQQYTRSGMHELNLDMDEFGSTDEESALSVLMTCDSDIGWEELPTIDDLVGDTAVVTFPSHKSKRRKRTYELRKDEIDVLVKKIKHLETKLDFLKHRAGVPDAQSVVQQSINNKMLREVLRNQQYLIAGLKSMLSADMSEHILSPVSTMVHLGTDPAKRRSMLQAMKYQKLHDAKRFIEKRTQFSNLSVRFSESTRFETENGDTFAVKFDIVPLRGAKSVQQVYDAVLFYFSHLEICMTEVLGDVTVREEHDSGGGDSVSQHRFLYSNRNGIQVETNSVQFSEFKQNVLLPTIAGDKSSSEEGIVTTDFVDQDDLFPYRPEERIRKEITTIFHIKTCRPCSQANTVDREEEDGDEDEGASVVDLGSDSDQLVVLTMWFQSKLRRHEFEIPEGKLQELIEDTDRVYDAILKSVRESLRSTPA